MNLQKYLQDRDREETEDTIIISGREITISQEPFVQKEIKAARDILQNLRKRERFSRDNCYITPIVKTIES